MKKLYQLIQKTYDTGKMPVKNMPLAAFRYLVAIYNELATNGKSYVNLYSDLILPLLDKCKIKYENTEGLGWVVTV